MRLDEMKKDLKLSETVNEAISNRLINRFKVGWRNFSEFNMEGPQLKNRLIEEMLETLIFTEMLSEQWKYQDYYPFTSDHVTNSIIWQVQNTPIDYKPSSYSETDILVNLKFQLIQTIQYYYLQSSYCTKPGAPDKEIKEKEAVVKDNDIKEDTKIEEVPQLKKIENKKVERKVVKHHTKRK